MPKQPKFELLFAPEVVEHLRVIYVPDAETESVFVITAYELTGKPLMAYRKRRRRR